MFGVKSGHINTAIVALAAYALVAFIQRKVVTVPGIGQYLPR